MASQEELLREIARGIGRLEQVLSRGAGAGGQAGAAASGQAQSLVQRQQQSFLQGAGRGGGGGFGGAALRGLGGLAGAGVGTALQTAGQLGAAGITAELRSPGGFAGGVGRAGLNLLASVPILGEGARQASNVLEGTQRDLNQLTGETARFSGAQAITPGVRAFLAGQFKTQNENLNEDRKANEAAVNNLVPEVTQGKGIVAEFVGELQKGLQKLRGDGGGTGAHL